MPDSQSEEERIASLLKKACGQVQASPDFKGSLLSRLMQERHTKNARRVRKLWARPLAWAPVAALALALVVLLIFTGLSGHSPGIVLPPPTLPDTSPTTIPKTPLPAPTPPSDSATPTPPPDSLTPILPSDSAMLTPPADSPAPTPPSDSPVIASTGILKIFVTDAPPQHSVTEINVKLSNVQASKDDDTGDDSGWVTVVAGNRSFDLIKLRDGSISELLGEVSLEIGSYAQIRMDVQIIDAVIDNERVEVGVTLPSGKLKVAAPFEIKEHQETAVTIDFDAAESLVFTGSDKVIFKPVVKLIVAYE
jgi:hypothetical protein